jgi:hypothetical protein
MKKIMKNKGRKIYKKPLIEEVDLKPEEAVLTGCKTIQGEVGPGGSKPICSNIATRCKNLGS